VNPLGASGRGTLDFAGLQVYSSGKRFYLFTIYSNSRKAQRQVE